MGVLGKIKDFTWSMYQSKMNLEVSEVLGFCSDYFSQASLGAMKLRSLDLQVDYPVLNTGLLLSKAFVFEIICFPLLTQLINKFAEISLTSLLCEDIITCFMNKDLWSLANS